MQREMHRIGVIGAGMGGLSAALRLAARGFSVTVFDRALTPGGKMRTVPSAAGPVDAGPTVLTMRWVFEGLFEESGAQLSDYVNLKQDPVLARHWWPDGSRLDLFSDFEASVEAVREFAGETGADDFVRFTRKARTLYHSFEGPMMQTRSPKVGDLVTHVLRQPTLIPKMAPLRSMAKDLARHFRDPRLRQLLGRYATYVGGSPYKSPALLSLIWAAEEAGVWHVEGGMQALAQAIATRGEELGVEFHFGAEVAEIETRNRQVTSVALNSGETHTFHAVVFNGDPQALSRGRLGDLGAILPKAAVAPRSYSAYVWSFAAEPAGLDLSHHNVIFGTDPKSEFDDLDAGRMPRDPTLYICAQDRGAGASTSGLERFEIIMNGPAGAAPPAQEFQLCHDRTMRRLACQGLSFSPSPSRGALTTPGKFNTLFPDSDGSLYGRSPSGMMSAFQRPTARTSLKGLYLAGGGTHPGAGVPMACLSGKHAAETIAMDLTSTSTSRPMAMPGGISTGSKTVAAKPSQSLGS